jgi:hypothetical protein
VNAIEEFNSYSYPEKGGNKPLDKNNHLMDCIRYIFDSLDDIGDSSGTVTCEAL